MGGHYDLNVHAVQLVHAPACCVLFHSVIPAKERITHPMNEQDEIDIMARTVGPNALDFEGLGHNPAIALQHATALQLVAKTMQANRVALVEREKNRIFQTDTNQLQWDMSQEGAGFFTANTPEVKVFAGFAQGRTIKLGEVELKVGKTLRNFATLSLLRREDGVYLLAATGDMYNTDGEPKIRVPRNTWEPSNTMTLSDQWGTAPVLCEGIAFEITLPGGPWNVWPLDEAGNRRDATSIKSSGNVIKLGPEHKTLWYEIRR